MAWEKSKIRFLILTLSISFFSSCSVSINQSAITDPETENPILTPPASFVFQSATVDGANVDLVWSASVGAESYEIRYGLNSGVYDQTVSTTSTSYTLSGLSLDVLYYVRIFAINSDGETQSNIERSITVASAPPPSTPEPSISLSNPASSPATDSTPTFSVTIPRNILATDLIEIFDNSSCSGSALASAAGDNTAASLEITLPSLAVEGPFTYYARFSPDSGTPNCSNSGVTYNYDITPPSTASALGFSVSSPFSGTSLSVSWQKSSSSDLSNQTVLLYQQSACAGSSTNTVLNSSSLEQRTLSSLVNGVTYSFVVRSTDAAGNYTDSSCSTDMLIDTTAPSAATALSWNASYTKSTQTSHNVTWTKSSSSDLASQVFLKYTTADCSGTPTTTSVGSSVESRSLTSLSYSAHGFRIRSVDGAGNQSNSACASLEVVPGYILVSDLAVTKTPNSPVTEQINVTTYGDATLPVGQLDGINYHDYAISKNGLNCGMDTSLQGSIGLWCSGFSSLLGSFMDGLSTTIEYNYPTVVSGSLSSITDKKQIAMGDNHICFAGTGQLKCLGDIGWKFGTGDSNPYSSFVSVGTFMTDAYKVAAGSDFTCYIDSLRQIHCAGGNLSGQLGQGTISAPISSFNQVSLNDVSDVTAGVAHVCALTNGNLYCWGANQYGQVGLDPGSGTQITTPQLVLTDVNYVSAGDYHTCATQPGAMKCWGKNDNGQLGLGYTSLFEFTPTDISGMTAVDDMALAANHTCVRESSGDVRCWGANTFGQVGTGDSTSIYDLPQIVTSNAGRVWAGANTTCVKTNSGFKTCWGSGNFGDGTTGIRRSPLASDQIMGSCTINSYAGLEPDSVSCICENNGQCYLKYRTLGVEYSPATVSYTVTDGTGGYSDSGTATITIEEASVFVVSGGQATDVYPFSSGSVNAYVSASGNYTIPNTSQGEGTCQIDSADTGVQGLSCSCNGAFCSVDYRANNIYSNQSYNVYFTVQSPEGASSSSSVQIQTTNSLGIHSESVTEVAVTPNYSGTAGFEVIATGGAPAVDTGSGATCTMGSSSSEIYLSSSSCTCISGICTVTFTTLESFVGPADINVNIYTIDGGLGKAVRLGMQ